MQTFSQRCKPFLDHLNICGGCSEKRSIPRCKFSLECAVAEVLARKGIVRNAGELLAYAKANRSEGYLPKGWNGVGSNIR